MDEQKLMQFVTWLGENVPELKGQAPEQIVNTINKLSGSEEGKQMLQGLIKEFESSMTGMFKKGGKLDYLLCLKRGGSIQDCGCGKKIKKAQEGSEGIRKRGTAPADNGDVRPDFNGNESAWGSNNGARFKNVFDGNTLHQNVVTYGEWGTPRRSVRVISDYDIPTKADTTYIDANGVSGRRNPSWWDRLSGNVHSKEFMDNLDAILKGAEPLYISEREVKANKK